MVTHTTIVLLFLVLLSFILLLFILCYLQSGEDRVAGIVLDRLWLEAERERKDEEERQRKEAEEVAAGKKNGSCYLLTQDV